MIIGERVLDRSIYYQYVVGVVYLLIGLFVYYRRVGAPRSVHFFVLCLASFVLSCFHYTGKLNAFDQAIYWGNVAAANPGANDVPALLPGISGAAKVAGARAGSACCSTYPVRLLLAVYVLVAKGMLRVAASPIDVNWFLDRVCAALLDAGLPGWARLVLALKTPHAEDPLVRRQLKYLRNGALLGIVPFTVIYAIPYCRGRPSGSLPEDGGAVA